MTAAAWAELAGAAVGAAGILIGAGMRQGALQQILREIRAILADHEYRIRRLEGRPQRGRKEDYAS
jgi:protein-disulfide isomerase-like protein with CxxC motif